MKKIFLFFLLAFCVAQLNAQRYISVDSALREKGYSKKEITKILGGNLLRVLQANSDQ